jgi:hypothetical protein
MGWVMSGFPSYNKLRSKYVAFVIGIRFLEYWSIGKA